MIKIQLNGQTQEISDNLRLDKLLHQLMINPRQVAVARNLEVIVHSELAFTTLKDGDEIEIFHAVGGG